MGGHFETETGGFFHRNTQTPEDAEFEINSDAPRERFAEYFAPVTLREQLVARQWRWVLKWWAVLVTVLTIHIPVFVFLVGFDVFSLPQGMFITYVSAATGGNTLLAVAGTYLLRPFGNLSDG